MSFASNNYATDVESLADHYTSVVTRFETRISMYPVESTSHPRRQWTTTFVNILASLLSSSPALMHKGQSNRGGSASEICAEQTDLPAGPRLPTLIFKTYFQNIFRAESSTNNTLTILRTRDGTN